MQNVILHAIVTPVLAQAEPGSSGGSPLGMLLPFVLMIAAMYFLVLAPQRKRQKEHQKMVSSLTTGDEVLTTGGIYGIVTNVKNDRLVVKIADGTKVEVGRTFVQAVEKKASSE